MKFWKLFERLDDFWMCVNGLQFVKGDFRVFVNIGIVFLFFQNTETLLNFSVKITRDHASPGCPNVG